MGGELYKMLILIVFSSGWKLYDLPSKMKQNVGRLPNKSAINLQFTSSLRPHWQEMIRNMFIQICILWSLSFSQTSLEAMAFQFHPWMMTDVIEGIHTSHSIPFSLTSEQKRYMGCRLRNNRKKCQVQFIVNSSNHTSIINHVHFYTVLPGFFPYLTLSHHLSPTPEVQAPFISLGAKKVPKIFGACVTTFKVAFLLGKKRWDFGVLPLHRPYRAIFFPKEIPKKPKQFLGIHGLNTKKYI